MFADIRLHATRRQRASIAASSLFLAIHSVCAWGLPVRNQNNSDHVDQSDAKEENKHISQIPEEKFLLNQDLMAQLRTACKEKPVKLERTEYGDWYQYTRCRIQINDSYPPLQEMHILKHRDSGKVKGYSAMIYGNGHYRSHLKVTIGESQIRHSLHTCSKFGWKTLPALEVVRSEHCDALQYSLL